MAENKTTLGIEVKTSGVAQAAADLQKLQGAASSAEKSTASMSSGINAVNAQLAAMAGKAKDAGQNFKSLDPAAQSLRNVAKEATKASSAFSGIGDNKSFAKIGNDAKGAANGIQQATRELDKFGNEARQAATATSGISGAFASLKSLVGGLFAGVGIAQFAGKLIGVQREFDVLNSSLVTITGSSQAAEREFAWIKDFAATTPFSLTEVTQAFVKLKTLGLDASRESLKSYGNTASAMGKSLNQMIEAVADASTGEFERLKEFGIRAKKSGDDVSLTFQGVTKTIKNSAEEITRYLDEIGKNNFAGAMEQRAKTLDGAISNLADSWDELFRTINKNDTGGLIFDSVKLAEGAIKDLILLFNSLGGATKDATRETGFFNAAQGGLSTVFETVAILGMNVKYVLVQIGNELGGLAAQAAAVAQLNFSGAAAIGRMMKEDAAAARSELDKNEKRILDRNKYNNDLGSLSAGIPQEPRKVTATVGGGGGKTRGGGSRRGAEASAEAKAYEQAMKSIADAERNAEKSTMDLSAAQSVLYDLMASPQWAKMPEAWKQTALAQFESARAAELNAKFLKDVQAQQEQNIKQRQGMIEQIQAAEKATEMYGLTEAQISVVEQARIRDAIAMLEEKDALNQLNGASEDETIGLRAKIEVLREELALRGKLSDALVGKERKAQELDDAKNAIKGASDEMSEFMKKAAQNMQDAFAEFLFDPFAKGTKSMAEQFGETVRKMIAQAASAQLLKLLFGDLGTTGNVGGLFGDIFKSMAGSFSFGSLFGGSSAASAASSFVPYTWEKGGIMTDKGPLPLNSYASGGIANSPQLALFGEGRMNEAYVPLPDGRRIPVAMKGGGGMNITQHIMVNPGADRAEVKRAAASGARSVLSLQAGARRYG